MQIAENLDTNIMIPNPELNARVIPDSYTMTKLQFALTKESEIETWMRHFPQLNHEPNTHNGNAIDVVENISEILINVINKTGGAIHPDILTTYTSYYPTDSNIPEDPNITKKSHASLGDPDLLYMGIHYSFPSTGYMHEHLPIKVISNNQNQIGINNNKSELGNILDLYVSHNSTRETRIDIIGYMFFANFLAYLIENPDSILVFNIPENNPLSTEPGATASELRAIIQTIENGSLYEEIKKLAKDRNPQDENIWKRIFFTTGSQNSEAVSSYMR